MVFMFLVKTVSSPFKIMMGGMFTSSHQFKILDSIVESVTIDMMDNFVSFKRSIEILFHYISMFKNLNIVYTNISIAMCSYPASILSPEFKPTGFVAKVSLVDQGIWFAKNSAAIVTYNILPIIGFPEHITTLNRACCILIRFSRMMRLKYLVTYWTGTKVKFFATFGTTKFTFFGNRRFEFFLDSTMHAFDYHIKSIVALLPQSRELSWL